MQNGPESDARGTPPSVVRFDGAALRYREGPEILTDLDFSLPKGSFHFLTGPSGAGKTSLLRLIYLARTPSRGAVHLFGADTKTLSANEAPFIRRRIGVVFQEFRLLDHLSVFENVALPLRVSGQKRRDYEDDVRELLAWVGLGDHMEVKPRTLSGGEQQRAAIARAVVGKPDLIIADEPTGNVDPEMGRRLMRLFVELNRLGATVVIATHDLDLVRSFAVPVLTLNEGRLTRLDRL